MGMSDDEREAAWRRYAIHWGLDPERKSEGRDNFYAGWAAARRSRSVGAAEVRNPHFQPLGNGAYRVPGASQQGEVVNRIIGRLVFGAPEPGSIPYAGRGPEYLANTEDMPEPGSEPESDAEERTANQRVAEGDI